MDLRLLLVLALTATFGLHGCGPSVAPATQSYSLSDEFDDPSSLPRWYRVEKMEDWNADQLERFDIGKTRKGWMTMVPYASTWYRDYRGVLAFQPIKGDFVATAKLHVTGRSGNGAPRAQFSLAGIMVRAPRSVSAQTWKPGGENYVFLSLGSADQPGKYQFEVKTTVNSDSQLATEPATSGEAEIRVARIGSAMLMLKRTDGRWGVHRRYNRQDFPPDLQVGLTCYTDWPTASSLQPKQHNSTVIRGGHPDLIAQFDYMRYATPTLPKSFAGRNFADPASVPDAEILRILGD